MSEEKSRMICAKSLVLYKLFHEDFTIFLFSKQVSNPLIKRPPKSFLDFLTIKDEIM